jgi:hypothetical protein
MFLRHLIVLDRLVIESTWLGYQHCQHTQLTYRESRFFVKNHLANTGDMIEC